MMHNKDSLPWFFLQGHGIETVVWWSWIVLCASAGICSLVWWWHRRGLSRQVRGRLREVIPPLGLILLGCSMLLLPAWSGLDVGLNEMDDVLRWAFLPEDSTTSTAPVSMASGGQDAAHNDSPSEGDRGEAP
ncbi:hypothetical protein [Serratia marcescens]|uniref:hypothetical protein n=1 Tax=Serratia marcescens TaxID=615 RepID=UPI004045FE6C